MKMTATRLIFAGMLTASFTLSATEVYEQVDDQGVPSFSDTPTSDTIPVSVDPNIVEVAPVTPLPPLAPEATTPPPSNSEQPADTVEEVGDHYYYENGVRKRRIAEKHHRDHVTPHRTHAPGAGHHRAR